MDTPADFLVLPCGHQCGCYDCLSLIQSATQCSGDPREDSSSLCPICSGGMHGIVKVFAAGIPPLPTENPEIQVLKVQLKELKGKLLAHQKVADRTPPKKFKL